MKKSAVAIASMLLAAAALASNTQEAKHVSFTVVQDSNTTFNKTLVQKITNEISQLNAEQTAINFTSTPLIDARQANTKMAKNTPKTNKSKGRNTLITVGWDIPKQVLSENKGFEINSFSLIQGTKNHAGMKGNSVDIFNLLNMESTLSELKTRTPYKQTILIVSEALLNNQEFKQAIIRLSKQMQSDIKCETVSQFLASSDSKSNVVILPCETVDTKIVSALKAKSIQNNLPLVVFSTQSELKPIAFASINALPLVDTIAKAVAMNVKNHYIYGVKHITMTSIPYFNSELVVNTEMSNALKLTETFSNAVNDTTVASKGSVDLNHIIEATVLNNLSIISANQSLKADKFSEKAVNSAYLPQLNAELKGMKIDNDSAKYSLGMQRENSFTGGMTLSQVIFNPELNFASKQAAINYSTSEINRDNLENTVYFQTVQTYLMVLKAKATEQFLKESLTRIHTNLSIAKLSEKVGTGDKTVVLRLESEEMAYKNQYLSAQMGVKNAITRLETYSQQSNLGQVEIKDVSYDTLFLTMKKKLQNQEQTEQLKEKLYQYALKNSLSILSVNNAITTAKANQSLEKQQFVLPTVTAFGTANRIFAESDASYPSSMGSLAPVMSGMSAGKSRNSWAVGIQVDFPIFTGFKKVNGINAADNKLASLITEKKQLESQLKSDIAMQINSLSMTLFSIDNSERNVTVSNKNLQLSELQFKKGKTTIVDFLDAQNTAFQAETQNSDLKYSYFETLYQLRTLINATTLNDSMFLNFIKN